MSTLNPFGLTTVTPYLMVRDARKLISFLEQVFDFKMRGKPSERADGSIQHVEFYIGDALIMMGETTEEFGSISQTKSGFYVYVENCDATIAKAIEAGGKLVFEPQNFPHGDRYGGVADFEENVWWIVQHIGTTQ